MEEVPTDSAEDTSKWLHQLYQEKVNLCYLFTLIFNIPNTSLIPKISPPPLPAKNMQINLNVAFFFIS